MAEADETFLLESQKGTKTLDRAPRWHGGRAHKCGISNELVNIVVARDRGGKTIDFIAGRGALKPAALHCHLRPKLATDVILMNDANSAYETFASQANIRHEAINISAGSRVRATVCTQNVNAYHSRFKNWLHHFNGVASSYLEYYAGWRWAIAGRRIDSAERFLRAALGALTTLR